MSGASDASTPGERKSRAWSARTPIRNDGKSGTTATTICAQLTPMRRASSPRESSGASAAAKARCTMDEQTVASATHSHMSATFSAAPAHPAADAAAAPKSAAAATSHGNVKSGTQSARTVVGSSRAGGCDGAAELSAPNVRNKPPMHADAIWIRRACAFSGRKERSALAMVRCTPSCAAS